MPSDELEMTLFYVETANAKHGFDCLSSRFIFQEFMEAGPIV